LGEKEIKPVQMSLEQAFICIDGVLVGNNTMLSKNKNSNFTGKKKKEKSVWEEKKLMTTKPFSHIIIAVIIY
jgi:hypothetical protein